MESTDRKAGIYVHTPFCERKCGYCDFYSITDLNRIPDFLKALQKEIRLSANRGTSADTLYVGGGTPSLLNPRQIGKIVAWAALGFNLSACSEMTIEITPATASTHDLRDYAALGFNRVSIGVQSFDDRNLAFLGRKHDAGQALAAVRAAQQAGFSNIGLDLIFGLPGQTPGRWKSDLAQAIELGPQHIACYMLTYEPHTPLHAELRAGRVVPLAESITAQLFRLTHAFLGAGGYEHYEISNFSRGARWRSRHNQKYWNLGPYSGLGPGAHSFRPPRRRWWNHRSLTRYLDACMLGIAPISELEELNAEQRMLEALYLGLRQADGLDLEKMRQDFHIDFTPSFQAALDRFQAQNWLRIDARRCRLTVEGMLFLDRIVGELAD